MNKFNRFMSTASLSFIAIIAIAFVMLSSYLRQNDLTLDDIFESQGTFLLGLDNSNIQSHFSTGKLASSFNTIIIEQTDTFPVNDILDINYDIEKVRFVKEDRNDIQIDYFREKPDTNLYKVTYTATSSSSKILVDINTSIRGINTNKNYEALITVRVPLDYVCKELHLTSALGDIDTNEIYDKTDNLYIQADLGNINIDIDTPKEVIDISSNLGDLRLNLNDVVSTLNVKVDLGEAEINSTSSIDEIDVDANLGSLDLKVDGRVVSAVLKANMGSVEATFKDFVKNVNADSNMGDMTLIFYNNGDSLVYGETDLGSFSSDFKKSSSKNEADIIVSANMGNIDIIEK